MDARSTYEVGRAAAARSVALEDGRIRAIGAARLLVVAAALGLLGALVWSGIPRAAWAGVAGLCLTFLALVVVHQRAFSRRARAAAVQRFHDRGLDRLNGSWPSHAANGAEFGVPGHPYAEDLDVLGKASLFQLLNTAETPFGQRALATRLLGVRDGAVDAGASWAEDLGARQAAVRELAGKTSLRERLSSVAHVVSAERPDPTPFVAWAESGAPWTPALAIRALAFLLPLLTIGSLSLGEAIGVPRWLGLVFGSAQLALLWVHGARTAAILGAASSKEGSFGRFGEVFQVLEGESFEAPLLLRLTAALGSGDAAVTREMAALGRIVGFVDALQNEVFRLILAPLLLWNFHCAVALERWRGRAGGRVRRWFATLGELEALASLAGYAHDDPSRSFPRLADHASFEARGMGHPLLARAHRVDNDVTLPRSGCALIVTGSNMSGKSTLLRAIGVNAVLGLAGAPVCVRELTLGEVAVATSMRVSDSLEAGVSHFLAELQRIKAVVDLASKRPPVLFLLDEILHGTNSRERLIGARAIVRSLTDRGAFGAVSTHDLGLADPVAALDGRVQNVHFEEQVDPAGTMTFDFLLRAGVVQSSNAIRLMRAVGLDVPAEDGVEGA